jgi:APA family basic amino acid/polyamine antiporter
VARKLRGFERVLDAPALFAVAYGEIASSVYFALGIVAAHALGATPLVLLLAGLIFVVVSLSYAEGVSLTPETGGGATVVRSAFRSDLAGFVVGWALALDYLIVIALAAQFLPHYLGAALGIEELRENPWDLVVGASVILGVAAVRLVRHARFHVVGRYIAGLDLVNQLLLVVLGFALLWSPGALTADLDIGTSPSWAALAFALPVAFLAYTGLETVANLAEETREPGRSLPRSLFSAIGLTVCVTVLVSLVGLSAYPPVGGQTALGEAWLKAPLVGIVEAFDAQLPEQFVDVLRVFVGVAGALILLAAATTSMSGCARLAHSLAEHGGLPRAFARLNRRTLVPPAGIVSTAVVATAVLVVTGLADDDVGILASLFSFGVLLVFTVTQLAVVRLRFVEPERRRPFRARPEVTIRGVRVPLPALVGAPLTFAVWLLALATHDAARYAGPAWLLLGLAVYGVVRVRRRVGLLADVEPVAAPLVAPQLRRILVPMKVGDIGEEMVATAIALARDSDAEVEAIYVIAVPRERPLDAPLPESELRAQESLEEARALGEDHGVVVATAVVRARSIGHAIVEEASARGVDLIVLGSSPRWRRQSRFFSPTVDVVLRTAPCEVVVVAFPQGVFEEGVG